MSELRRAHDSSSPPATPASGKAGYIHPLPGAIVGGRLKGCALSAVKIDLSPEATWKTAIAWWEMGEERPVLGRVLSDEPIPTFAKEWIARTLLQSLRRPKGRPKAKLHPMMPMFVWFLFEPKPVGRGLPRTRVGFVEAANELGITSRQVESLIAPKRKHVRGHKPYPIQPTAHDPFGRHSNTD